MSNCPARPRPLRFGAFDLDLSAGGLRKDGAKVKLQDQPLQILALLLEHPGQIVTRDELRKRLWPDDTFVDYDHSLNKGVNKLRDALEDSADHPRFIETIPKRGYRFIADVTAAEPPVKEVPLSKPYDKLSRSRLLAALLLLAVLIA